LSGQTAMASRPAGSSSVSYAGPPLLLAGGAAAGMASRRKRALLVAAVTAYSAVLAVSCYRRAWVWTNSETLWTDVIEKYPFRFAEDSGGLRVVQRGVTTAYENRGNWYREHADLDRAVRDYDV